MAPRAQADLNFLASNMSGLTSSREVSRGRLKILLQHASIANYNRQIVNWELDNETYRNYVLSPTIEPSTFNPLLSTGLVWRRLLWEYFYPLIRKETDATVAADIVMKLLRQRTMIVAKGSLNIEEMWQRQEADAKGFEVLKVAAFRSVGIPSRLNENREAEIFVDGRWQASLR